MSRLIVVLSFLLVIGGCKSLSDQTKPDLFTQELENEINALQELQTKDVAESVLDIKIAQKPKKDAFLFTTIPLTMPVLNYRNVMNVLPGLLGKRVLIHPGLKGDEPFLSINYKGTVQGLFDNICYTLKCSWGFNQDVFYITKYKTKSWRLPILPTSKNGSVELSSGNKYGGDSSSTSPGGQGVETGSSGTSIAGDGGQSLTSSYQYTTKNTVDSLISPYVSKDEGLYTYSAQTGLLSVTASNMSLDMIDSAIEGYTSKLTAMVNFDVSVVIYDETDSNSLGLRWDLVWNNLSDLGINVSNNSNVDSTSDSIGFSVLGDDRPFSGSSAMVEALSEHVRVASKKDFSFRTLSNQMLPFSVADEIPFQIVESTLVPNVGVVQRVVIHEKSVGLHLNMLPVILDNNALLVEFKASFTTLNDIVEIDLGENGSARIPQTSVRETMQQLNMKNGESVVLTGFSMTDSNVSKRSPFASKFWFAGGSKNGTMKKSSMVIIVTPRIIK